MDYIRYQYSTKVEQIDEPIGPVERMICVDSDSNISNSEKESINTDCTLPDISWMYRK